MFETVVGHSFKCVSEQSLQLSAQLQMKTMNVHLQAFDFEGDSFGNGKLFVTCPQVTAAFKSLVGSYKVSLFWSCQGARAHGPLYSVTITLWSFKGCTHPMITCENCTYNYNCVYQLTVGLFIWLTHLNTHTCTQTRTHACAHAHACSHTHTPKRRETLWTHLGNAVED